MKWTKFQRKACAGKTPFWIKDNWVKKDERYKSFKKQKKELGIESLPETLYDAVKALEKDSYLVDFLGEETAEKYIDAKKKEWKEYKIKVSQWEIDEYLYKF